MKGNKFERVEQKYLLNQDEYDHIQTLIKKYFDKDRYYQSKIYNIYFDNDNNDLLIDSLEKPIFKKKIRLRSYDGINKNDNLYFEIKEKYKGIVYKRRIKLTVNEYNKYINERIIPDKQIMKEIDYYINYYKVHPYIFLAYDRLSYCGKDNPEFRITFDTNLRYRYDNLELIDTNNNQNYFKDNKYIMEVKTLDSLPCWFVNYLSVNKIYPRSFSKVGSIYEKERGLCYVR